jgi:hypothetical protein
LPGARFPFSFGDPFEDLMIRKGVDFVTDPANRLDGQRYTFFKDDEGKLWEISYFLK